MIGREYVAVFEERGKIIHNQNVSVFILDCGDSRLAKYTPCKFHLRKLKVSKLILS